MKQVTIHEAKTHLSKLIRLALDGEEIIIARGSQPVVRLIAIPGMLRERQLGTYPDLVTFIADDFDAPLDDFTEYAP